MKIDLSKCNVGDKVIFRNKQTGTIVWLIDYHHCYYGVSCASIGYNLSYADNSGKYWLDDSNKDPRDIIRIIPKDKPKKIPYMWIVEWYDNDDKTWSLDPQIYETRRAAQENSACILNKTRIRKYVQAD
jgi:hypothetical protein